VRRLALALLLTACGGGRPPPTPPPELTRPSDAPEVTIAGIALPRMPEDVTPQSEDLRDGWELAERALTMPAPRPPTGEAWEVEAWATDELADWMRRRGEAVADVQRAFEPARHGDAEESVVASMLLGLAYARFALDLRGLDTPSVFSDDPARAEEYRTALERAARPLWLRALDAFGSCASVAGEQPAHHLGRWRERCDREAREASAMLPRPAEGEAEDDDEAD